MNKSEQLRRVGNLAQLGGTRHYTLNSGTSKGVNAIDVNTGTGFMFTVVPDRGLDISLASYRGTNLVHLTPNGEANAAFYEPEGAGWLRTFFAGLLTTCGLTHLGAPVQDGPESLGLHGRHTVSPAHQVCDTSRWVGDEYVIEISGIVEDAYLFGPKIRLTRTITTAIGKRSLRICDVVENFGYKPCPFTILYHVNAGYPLLDDSSELILNAETSHGINEHSQKDLDTHRAFSAPIEGFEEQNYLHTLKADADGYSSVAFVNRRLGDGLGLTLRFRKDALPYLNEWKMMAEGDYVVGIEPANVPCENRVSLREKGLLPMLAPGETKTIELEIAILDGLGEIEEFAKNV